MSSKLKKRIFIFWGYCAWLNIHYPLKKLLNKTSLLILLIGVFLLPASAIAIDITPENIIALTNQERKEAGIHALTANQLLAKAAYDKGRAILSSQTFQHTINGKKFSGWIRDAEYYYSYVGENLAINFTTGEGVIEAWNNSYTHRKNLLNPLFKEIGVAVVEGDFNDTRTQVIVQIFGTPPALTVTPELIGANENRSLALNQAEALEQPALNDSLSTDKLAALSTLTHSVAAPPSFKDSGRGDFTFLNHKPSRVLAAGGANNYSLLKSGGAPAGKFLENNSLLFFITLLLLSFAFFSLLLIINLYYYYIRMFLRFGSEGAKI